MNEFDFHCAPKPSRYQVRSLYRIAYSKKMSTGLLHIDKYADTVTTKLLVAGILCVEISARPGPIRVLEWIWQFFLRIVGSPTKLTLGPFQIRDGPWDLEQAAKIACRSIREANCVDARSASYVWNGPLAAESNFDGSLSYEQCLKVAISFFKGSAHHRKIVSCRHRECLLIADALRNE